MAIHIRNAESTRHAVSSTNMRWFVRMLREAFLAAGWTQSFQAADPEWTDNSWVDLSFSASVNSASPLVVNDPGGGFLASHEGKVLTLEGATNDENSCICRIIKVLDANNLNIEFSSRAQNWVTETGITARIHDCGQSSLLSIGKELVMQAPGAIGYEVRFLIDTIGYRITCYVLPYGDRSTTDRESGGITMTFPTTTYQFRLNAYIDDQNALLYWHNGGGWSTAIFTVLDDVGTGDTNPVVMFAQYNTDWNILTGSALQSGTGLNKNDAAIDHYPMWPKYANDQSASSMFFQTGNIATRQIGANLWAIKPRILLWDSGGKTFPRGRWPFYVTHFDWSSWRPLSASYNNRKTNGNVCVPIAGSSDPVPLESISGS